MNKIDFVLTWVDGNDREWLKSKEEYSPSANGDTGQQQYRYWDTLKYWFRAVEKYAPWVGKIHFVTCGQKPDWLDENHPKLNLVNHIDYIPAEFLPTFSSHVIELFFHRIAGLSDSFVYFNDDFFLNAPTSPEDFFNDSRPCDAAVLSVLSPSVPGDPFAHYLLNNAAVINDSFSKRSAMRKNFSKWYSPYYKRLLKKNIIYSPLKKFSAFENFHIPQSYQKSTYEEVWDRYPEILTQTASHKFRDLKDVNQYVFRYWQLASGNFCPRNIDFGAFYTVGEKRNEIFSDILLQKHKVICINDSVEDIAEDENRLLAECFEKKFCDKSSFEI